MKDTTQGQLTTPRILFPVLIPGLVMLLSYLFAFGNSLSSIQWLLDSMVLGGMVLLILALAVGFIIEDISSHIEARLYDRWLGKRISGFTTTWEAYLRAVLHKDEAPIAQNYLRTILIRLKFELSMQVALLFSIPAIWLAEQSVSLMTGGILTGAVAILILYLFYEGYNSARILHTSRIQILAAVAAQANALPAASTGGTSTGAAGIWIGSFRRSVQDVRVLQQSGEWYEIAATDIASGKALQGWMHREALQGIWQ